MKIKWILADLHACGAIRGEYPARRIMEMHNDITIDCKRDLLDSDFSKTDIVVLQRAERKEDFMAMRRAQERGIKCIFETDDDMLSMPDGLGNLTKKYQDPKMKDTIRSFYQYADAVIASTKLLADAIQPYTGSNVYVVKNYVDAEAYLGHDAFRRCVKKDKVTIGWTNSPAHKLDVPMVSAALKQTLDVCPNAEFLTIGVVDHKELGPWAESDLYKGRIRYLPWVHITKLPEIMRDIDVGLCPLIDNQFNRCRSDIKWMQYSALGIPTIVQDGPVYACVKNDEIGIVASDEDSWHKAMVRLVNDENLRRLFGDRSRLEVLVKYDIKNNADKWVNVFRHVLKGK